MARWSRSVAWTGAALAWGTALTIPVLEPESAQANLQAPTSQPPTSAVVPASQVTAMPTSPARGLVILRYQPSTDSSPDVRTVYVQQKAPQASNPALATAPVPAPRSGGS